MQHVSIFSRSSLPDLTLHVRFGQPSLSDHPALIPAATTVVAPLVGNKPRVPISAPTLLASEVAVQLGTLLARHGFYNLGGQTALVGSDGQSLDVLSPERFRVVLEKFVVPVRVDAQGAEQPQSLTLAEAREILGSELFSEQLPGVDHFNPNRLPIFVGSQGLERLGEGYHAQRQVLTAPSSLDYPMDLASVQATGFLNGLLQSFPLVDAIRDKAAVVAAMLTPFAAELFAPKTIKPAFLFNGDGPGLGKNLLVQLCLVPVHGSAPAAVKARDEEETRKLCLAVARERRPFLFLDNVTRLASPSLESFLTAGAVEGRVLGQTEMITCLKNTLVYVTGNRPTLSPDMARRTVRISLSAQAGGARPVPSPYLDEPRINELRGQILGAMFTLVRQWVAAGRPKPTRINPNFVRWSEIVGGILEHAGFGLPY